MFVVLAACLGCTCIFIFNLVSKHHHTYNHSKWASTGCIYMRLDINSSAPSMRFPHCPSPAHKSCASACVLFLALGVHIF